MGGLSKKSSLLKGLATSADILKLDAGTLFFDEKLTGQPRRLPQAIITASAMVDAYNLMGYDAIAIGRQDLSAGLHALQTLATRASFPFLSANLVDTNGSLLFTPFTLIERAGIRIALIGLTGQTNLPGAYSDTVKISPWQHVLPQIVAKISTKSDLVVILSNLSALENREIAEQMADVHLIFQSGVSKQNMRPQLINNTLISQAGHDGRYQGQLTVHWTASQKWQQGETSRLTLQKEYDRLGWMINRVRKKGGPQVVYKDNGANLNAFLKKRARYHELEAEIKKMAQDEKMNTPDPATYSNHFHPLLPSVKDDAAIIRLLKESRQRANKMRRQVAETKRLNGYIGSSACRSCHDPMYLAWSQTAHATSYKTLQDRDQNNNLNCVYCHVTGLDDSTAYLAPSMAGNLRAVGCEACHGPGKEHAANPNLAPPSMTPHPALCINCHTPQRDDNFNYMLDKAKIH